MRTPTIRKLLREAGLLIPSTEGLIEFNSKEIEVLPFDGGDNEYDSAEELLSAVQDALSPKYRVSGFRSGYGSWVVYEGYQSLGDWNDKSSRHHY